MPSITLLLAAFYVLTSFHGSIRRSANAALAGGLAGAAVLFHESAGLFLVVGLAGVLMAEYDPLLLPPAARRQRRTLALVYLAAGWALSLSPICSSAPSDCICYTLAHFGIG